MKAKTKNLAQSNKTTPKQASIGAFTQAKLEKALKSLENVDLSGVAKKSV